MSDKQNSSPLVLPALKGHMGIRSFYTACVKMKDLAERVEIASVLHKSKELSRLIQREVTEGHAKKIEKYLAENPERFFNALVIGVYGGMPEWFELSVSGNVDYPDGPGEDLEGIVGYLQLSGKEQLFAIDGQHRIVGIQKVLEAFPERGNEEVTAIFVAHKDDQEGEQRTRRLFTTLNRYAKQVSIMEKIALDEDDVIAITTRRLMEESDLLRDRLSITKGKAIPVSDKTNITTVAGLYDALDLYLRPEKLRGWADFKRFRPSDEVLEDYYSRAVTLWNSLYTSIPELKSYIEQAPNALPYRNASGGHLLFRVIGLDIIFRVVRLQLDSGLDVDESVKRVASVPMQLNQEPWIGVLWNPIGRMLTDSVNKRIATALLLQKVGGDLAKVRMTELKLSQEVAGLQGR